MAGASGWRGKSCRLHWFCFVPKKKLKLQCLSMLVQLEHRRPAVPGWAVPCPPRALAVGAFVE